MKTLIKYTLIAILSLSSTLSFAFDVHEWAENNSKNYYAQKEGNKIKEQCGNSESCAEEKEAEAARREKDSRNQAKKSRKLCQQRGDC